jgi:hypothetical protein
MCFLTNIWIKVIIFLILAFSLGYNFLNYKKGKKIAYYYTKGFLFILLAFLIQISKSSLEVGSLLDILGLAVLFFFLILGLYNIFYLSGKKSKY